MANLRNMAHLAAVALLLGPPSVAALTIEYCSDANTASASTLETSIYQSNGLCEDQCSADYAFAVLQGDDCWCSDYIPASQTDVSDCDSSCPGYPSDTCGNPDEGLYGYIAMASVSPSGTAAGTTGTASASTTASTTTSKSSSSSSSSSTSDPPTTTASPSTALSTVAGQVVTITVSEPTSTSSASSSSSGKGSSLSGGAIAGIVIGALAGVGAIAALALWYFFFGRRRDDNRSEKSGSPTGGNDGSITGATTDTRRQSRGSQMSFMRNFMGPADQETSPISPVDYLSPSQAFIDNRMKKNAVLYPNGDRQSAVSLRDDEDYSRPVLRLTNPD